MSLKSQPRLQLLPPLTLPWHMKDVSTAKTRLENLPGGFKQMIIQHELLRGVTPAMLVHWFTHLLAGQLTIDGNHYPAYRVWHPNDHIAVNFTKSRSSDVPGCSPKAIIHIQECFGANPDYAVDNRMCVERIDEMGITLRADILGVEYARLEHRFLEGLGGTHYISQLRIGTMLPGISPFARRQVERLMPDHKARAWFRHNVEEVGNFQFFLPEACARDPQFCG